MWPTCLGRICLAAAGFPRSGFSMIVLSRETVMPTRGCMQITRRMLAVCACMVSWPAHAQGVSATVGPVEPIEVESSFIYAVPPSEAVPGVAGAPEPGVRRAPPGISLRDYVIPLDGAVTEPYLDERFGGGLDIVEAVRRVVQWHPSVSEAVALLMRQDEQVNVARARYYPQVSGGVRAGYDSSYEDDGYSQSLVLSVSQMLYDFGKVSSTVRAARSGVLEQQANVLLSADSIALQAAQALVEVQRYQHLQGIATEQLEGLEKVAALARERNRKGASSRSDVVQTESRIEGARGVLLQYRAQLERWRSTLSTLLGGSRVVSVSDRFPAILAQGCSPEAIDGNAIPSVLMAQARHDQARAQLDNARAQSLPTLSVDPSMTHYLDESPNPGSTRDRTQYGVFLNVNMPIYQGGAIQAQKQAAAHALDSADAAIQSARLLARQGLLESRTQSQGLRHSLDVQVRRQGLSEQTRDLYRQQYLELGTRPLLDLLNAEQEIHQARFDYHNTRTELRQLQLSCLHEAGGLRQAFNLKIRGVEVRP